MVSIRSLRRGIGINGVRRILKTSRETLRNTTLQKEWMEEQEVEIKILSMFIAMK